MSVNKAIILGNCGNDPEIRQNQNGEDIANFSIATSESWKDKATGEKKEKTEWHKVVAFGSLAGIVKNYVKKGTKLYIEGQLQTRKWTDNNGVEKYTTEIVLKGFNSNLQLLDSKDKSGKPIDSHNEAKANAYQPQDDDMQNDEIPF
ncbi:MAG: single-stranded DNA-binding protein [Pelagibacterales bacterium]|nr:single-stranded DNA-binding protein [Pelagibacterales bacterium]